MNLARSLSKTKQQLFNAITSSELSEWQDYYSKQPWPWIRDDWRQALASSIASEANGNHRLPSQCLLKFDSPGKNHGDEEVSVTRWDAWADCFPGNDEP